MITDIKFNEQKEKILLQRGKLIHEGKQGKHIVGHNNYKEEEGKSITILPMAKIEELLKKYAGTGQIARDNGERVDFKEIIGIYVNQHNNKKCETTVGIIHYSKSGLHIVPARPSWMVYDVNN